MERKSPYNPGRAIWLLFAFTVAACFLGAFFTGTGLLSSRELLRTQNSGKCFKKKSVAKENGLEYGVDQVVMVIIDALRPDFSFKEMRRERKRRLSEQQHGSLLGVETTSSTLTYIEESLTSAERRSLGFVLVADAPTTTSQRVKAIATGTLPAFVEIGGNLDSDEVVEDSLVDQFKGEATVLGDGTWGMLFPRHRWKDAVLLPPFDVRDLHTLDNVVLHVLYDALRGRNLSRFDADALALKEGYDPTLKRARDRDITTTTLRVSTEGQNPDATETPSHPPFLIAHFVGVDHAGHRFHANDDSISSKLAQLNVMLRNVSQVLQQRKNAPRRTLLMVLGDHGMTEGGDHGGESLDETDTFLFVEMFRSNAEKGKCNESFTDTSIEYLTRLRHRHCDLDGFCRLSYLSPRKEPRPPYTSNVRPAIQKTLSGAHQVDVVPTIAALLGTADVPFSNVGRTIGEVLMLSSCGEVTTNEEERKKKQLAQLKAMNEQVLHALECNRDQIREYAKHTDIRNLTDEILGIPNEVSLEEDFETLQAELPFFGQEGAALIKEFLESYADVHNALGSVGQFARSRWTHVKEDMMVLGIFVMLPGLFVYIAPTFLAITRPHGFYFKRYSKLSTCVLVATFSVLFVRNGVPFANSFIVKEDVVCNFIFVTIVGILLFYLSYSPKSCSSELRRAYVGFAVSLTLVSRIAMIVGQRPRFHGTHVAASHSWFMRIYEATKWDYEQVFLNKLILRIELTLIGLLVIYAERHSKKVVLSALAVLATYVTLLDGNVEMHFVGILAALLSFALVGYRMFLSFSHRPIPGAVVAAAAVVRFYLVIWVCSLSDDVPRRANHVFHILALVILNEWFLRFFQAHMAAPEKGNIVTGLTKEEAVQIDGFALFGKGHNERMATICLLYSVVAHLMSWLFYFSSGQQCIFSLLNLASAYVGMPIYIYPVATFLLISHTFSSFFLSAIFSPPTALVCSVFKEKTQHGNIFPMLKAMRWHILRGYVFFAYVLVVMSSISLYLRRRHLMLWAIFGPKFMFDVVMLAVSCVGGLLNAILVAL